MKQPWKKSKVIYYSDIYNDDFDQTSLKRLPIPTNYKYKRDNFFLNILYCFIYYGLAKPILSIGCFFNGVRVGNRKKLKELRKCGSGVFLYGNHVAFMDAFKMQAYIIHRRTNIIGFTDSLNINWFVSFLVKAIGYLPLPLEGDYSHLRDLDEAIKFYINKKQHILIYPEAHVWPYYTKIREFKNGSFHYPAKLNKPIMPFVTIWKKVWWRKKPVQVIVFGDLIYPKEGLSVHENRDYLHDECLKAMQKISSSYKQTEYIKYIYKEKDVKINNIK